MLSLHFSSTSSWPCGIQKSFNHLFSSRHATSYWTISHSLVHLITLSSPNNCPLPDPHKSLWSPYKDTDPENANCSVLQNRNPSTFYMTYSQKLKSYILCFEVFMAMIVEIGVFWVVIPCSPVNV
jgi:hypothetical protein